jgi:alpha-mannosidase
MKKIGRTQQVFLILVILFIAAPRLPGQEPDKNRALALQNPREYTAHLVGHAHIDLSWLWRWEETVNDIAVQTFKGTLAQMAKMPGLTFAQSQAAVYEAIEKNYPSLFEEIRRKVGEGTWIPVGGMWAEPDLNMPDGESFARQLLYGKRYFLDKFGVDVTVGWNPDAFGHNWQLPQILNKAGIRYYIFERCAPEKTPFFWWEGKDGSRLLCHVPQGWYLVSLKNGLNDVLRDASTQTPVKDFLILYGEGDHGGGPRDTDVAAIEKYKNDPNHPKMIFSDPAGYFQKIEASGVSFPVVRKELNFTFPACYTTQAATKKWNRTMEHRLLEAERFSALAVASGLRDYYPERDIDEAWKTVLRNQFHDILDGSSIGPVYEESGRFYREALSRSQRALDFSLETILNAADTSGDGIPVAVFNPLFWPTTDAVEVVITLPGGTASVKILAPGGKSVPAQVLEKRTDSGQSRFRLTFLASEVPSFGYRVYHAVSAPADEKAPEGSPLSVGAAGLENAFFKVAVDPKTGWITSLYDKRQNREVFSGPGNVLQATVDEPETMSAWELGLKGSPETLGSAGATVEVVESGPVRAVLRVRTPFRNSLFVQDLILYAGLARLDVRASADWQERNLMIKVAFPVNVKSGQAEFEIPYGSVTRPADGTEVPALRWVDISDAASSSGLSVLNDGKYGFDAKGTMVRMSVVHGATSPDPEADRGRHEFRYSLYPHAGTWREADTIRRGLELNSGLITRTGMVHKGALSAERSFVRAAPANVVLSGFKMESGYNSRNIIVRVYEAFGKKTEAKISFPWPVRAEETDLIERPVKGRVRLDSAGEDNAITVPLAAYEIKTLRIQRKQ